LQGLVRGLPKARDLLTLPSQRLDEMGERLPRALMSGVERRRTGFAALAAKVTPHLLQERLQRAAARVADLDNRQRREVRALMTDKTVALGGLQRLLQSLSYEQVLARGFVVVRDNAGQPVTHAASVATGDALDLQFADGHVS